MYWNSKRGNARALFSAIVGMKPEITGPNGTLSSVAAQNTARLSLCIAWWKDHAHRLWLHIDWVAASHIQPTAKVRTPIRGVVCDHVRVCDRDPLAIDQQSHNGLAIHNRLDEVGGRPTISIVAARLPIAIFVASVIHFPVVHMRGRGHTQKNAGDKPQTLHDTWWFLLEAGTGSSTQLGFRAP